MVIDEHDDERTVEQAQDADAAGTQAEPVDVHSDCAKKMSTLQESLKTAQEKALYLASDFETFRKRSEASCLQRIDHAKGTIFKELLAVLDDFERAFVEIEQKPEIATYLQGFELSYKALQKMLASQGVTEITQMITFDPQLHEAVMSVDLSDKKSGEIVAVLQKGYLYRGVLLRPARVSVKA